MPRPIPFDPLGLRPPAGRYLLNPERTMVGFTARALGFPVRGRFSSVAGSIDIAEDPGQSQVTARVGAASLQTGSARRDAHITGADFLDAAAHPVLRFQSTRLQPAGEDQWAVVGDLTIRGVTSPVTLEARCHGWSSGGQRLRVAATTTLDRADFGVRGYRPLIANTVVVTIQAEVTSVTARKDPR